jgi:hypothetical protein
MSMPSIRRAIVDVVVWQSDGELLHDLKSWESSNVGGWHARLPR